MKKGLLVGLIALGLPIVTIIGFQLYNSSQPLKISYPKKIHTEDMEPVVKSVKGLAILFADSVDGRPTYTVCFPDSTVLDSMYPEEIANGLVTGTWRYDEDFSIQANLPCK